MQFNAIRAYPYVILICKVELCLVKNKTVFVTSLNDADIRLDGICGLNKRRVVTSEWMQLRMKVKVAKTLLLTRAHSKALFDNGYFGWLLVFYSSELECCVNENEKNKKQNKTKKTTKCTDYNWEIRKWFISVPLQCLYYASVVRHVLWKYSNLTLIFQEWKTPIPPDSLTTTHWSVSTEMHNFSPKPE